MQPIPDTTVPEPIPAAVVAQINAKIAEIETDLAPYLRSLTNAQRVGLPKMGEDSVEFVQNGINAVNFSTDYLPRDFDETQFKNAFALTRQLAPIVQRLDSLARGADDAEFLFGSIAYTDALEVYSELGTASKKNSALLAFYDAMKIRFAKLRGKRPAPNGAA